MIPYFVIHSFTDKLFGGNPAGVCLLMEWIDQSLMQRIAYENDLSETAFFVPKDGCYELRWFTPKIEVDLCGHATLASAFVLFEELGYQGDVIVFRTQSGDLHVSRSGSSLVMDFPSRPPEKTESPKNLRRALNAPFKEVHKSADLLVVFDSEMTINDLNPDFSEIAQLDCSGLIVTAPG
ncbi:MAG: PhzF family phenazine biosynthesis protein, partial [Acidobacteriota bacterium]